MPVRLDTGQPGFPEAFARLLSAKREAAADVDQAVAAILDQVRIHGDDALCELSRRFDRIELSPATLRITTDEIDAAVATCDPALLDALKLAAQRISSFHERQRPTGLDFCDDAGMRLGYRWTPITAAGLYVPGGTAAYPSSVLMNALPARVAGVDRLVMTVPTPDGIINPLVLAAARLAGVDEIYRVGGAQAVGALAFGTKTITPVDKIVGPGNAYVAAAKRRVFGIVGIDMIAGPSEVLIIADGSNDPDWMAADLLAQAEHDEAAQSILITDDSAFAERVDAAVAGHLETLPRRDIAASSWENFGCIIVVAQLEEEAPALADRIAPEHLQLAVDQPDRLFQRIRHAGSVFLGRFTPEAIGDYVAGPNHVLPTGRSARFSSGLGVLDFMKRTTFLGCDSGGLGTVAEAAIALAEAEGLSAHARSIRIRLNR